MLVSFMIAVVTLQVVAVSLGTLYVIALIAHGRFVRFQVLRSLYLCDRTLLTLHTTTELSEHEIYSSLVRLMSEGLVEKGPMKDLGLYGLTPDYRLTKVGQEYSSAI